MKNLTNGRESVKYLLSSKLTEEKADIVAEALFSKFGSFSRILDANKQELLSSCCDITEEVASLIKVFPKLMDLYFEEKYPSLADSVSNLGKLLVKQYVTSSTSVYSVAFINACGEVEAIKDFYDDYPSNLELFARKAVELIVKNDGEKVIICHNKIGSDVIPTKQEISLVSYLHNALNQFDIEIKDYISVNESKFVIMSEARQCSTNK